jgi:PPOX class probable F420-dependent enzyme
MTTLGRSAARAMFVAARVARLATVDAEGRPHLVPIVFVVEGETVYLAVDQKPKRTTSLRRLDNVAADPAVSVLVDHYDDADWSALYWARADGVGRVLAPEHPEARAAVDRLAVKHRQHAQDRPAGPVLAIDVTRWSGWSATDPAPASGPSSGASEA